MIKAAVCFLIAIAVLMRGHYLSFHETPGEAFVHQWLFWLTGFTWCCLSAHFAMESEKC